MFSNSLNFHLFSCYQIPSIFRTFFTLHPRHPHYNRDFNATPNSIEKLTPFASGEKSKQQTAAHTQRLLIVYGSFWSHQSEANARTAQNEIINYHNNAADG